PGEVDDAHPALAELSQDPVLTEDVRIFRGTRLCLRGRLGRGARKEGREIVLDRGEFRREGFALQALSAHVIEVLRGAPSAIEEERPRAQLMGFEEERGVEGAVIGERAQVEARR